jgi:signal transduction histidine kinase
LPLEERERIAMDLLDRVIQSIFATGLRLEDAGESLGRSEQTMGETLQKAIRDLNAVITDIRHYIFVVRTGLDGEGFEPALSRTVEEAAANPGVNQRRRL